MREIKFRAWDKNKMKLIPFERLYFEIEDGYGAVQEWQPVENSGYYDEPTSNFNLMQYTGLKDKNGTEIYEGDIIKGETTWPFEVLIKQGHTKIKWKDDNKEVHEEDLCQYYINTDELEIIGNIYENSELVGVRYE